MLLKKGDRVYWNWGEAPASGVIVDFYKSTENNKGPYRMNLAKKMLRLLLIKLDDGRKVLKLETEIKQTPLKKQRNKGNWAY